MANDKQLTKEQLDFIKEALNEIKRIGNHKSTSGNPPKKKNEGSVNASRQLHEKRNDGVIGMFGGKSPNEAFGDHDILAKIYEERGISKRVVNSSRKKANALKNHFIRPFKNK